MIPRRMYLVVIAGFVSLAIGCGPGRELKVEMRVVDGALERTVIPVPDRYGRPASEPPKLPSFSKEDAERLARIYGAARADGTFSARFDTLLPADLEGAGALHHSTTDLGTTFRYHERLKGQDSPSSFMRRIDAGTQQVLEITDGWIRAELGDQPATAVLDRFVRERVIPDLRDRAVYQWMADSGLMTQNELELRSVQLLAERGYFDASEVRTTADIDIVAVLRRHLDKQGVALDERLARDLERLADYDSLKHHIARSDRFRTWLRDAARDEADLAKIQPALDAFLSGNDSAEAKNVAAAVDAYIDEQLVPALRLVIGSGRNEASIALSLELADAPLETNGSWSPERRRVEWDLPMRSGDLLPAFAYASWAVPDVEFQTAHFGVVALKGSSLRKYNYTKLDPELEEEWNELLQGLTPADALPRLRQFRFSTRPEASPDIARLLIDALEKAQQPVARTITWPDGCVPTAVEGDEPAAATLCHEALLAIPSWPECDEPWRTYPERLRDPLPEADLTFYPLSTGRYLVELPCLQAAYNQLNVYVLYDETARPPRAERLTFDGYGPASSGIDPTQMWPVKEELIFGRVFDPERKLLFGLRKFRGMGDIGHWYRYSFATDRPVLEEFWARHDEDGNALRDDYDFTQPPPGWTRIYPPP